MINTIYAKTALKAVSFITEKNVSPLYAWENAVKLYTKSKTSQNKPCPKGTFLGLCEEGLIKGIPSGSYTDSEDNKTYAINAVKLLSSNPSLAKTKMKLWHLSCKSQTKKHNSQMDVVIALWENSLLN